MSQRSARLSSPVQVFLLTVKEISSFFAILPLLTQRRLFSRSFSGLLRWENFILDLISAPLSFSLLLALIYFYLHIWKQNQKKPADFPFARLFECGPFQPPWLIGFLDGAVKVICSGVCIQHMQNRSGSVLSCVFLLEAVLSSHVPTCYLYFPHLYV